METQNLSKKHNKIHEKYLFKENRLDPIPSTSHKIFFH